MSRHNLEFIVERIAEIHGVDEADVSVKFEFEGPGVEPTQIKVFTRGLLTEEMRGETAHDCVRQLSDHLGRPPFLW